MFVIKSQNSFRLATTIILFALIPSLFFLDMSCSVESGPYTSTNIQVAVLLHYDTYYASVNLDEMHQTFEKTLSELKDNGFPMSKVLVVTWRNTLDNIEERTWILDTLSRYSVLAGNEQLGLYLSYEDAHSESIINYALEESFFKIFGRYPYFVAGFSSSSSTYTQLVEHGVKLSFFNLWEEGEDYSYRGFSTGDNLYGANWEGSSHQPYKPSRHTANAPGLTEDDELDIWETHWITRNPSYAYLAVNSRNIGSIHPFDLLHASVDGVQKCSAQEAFQKFNKILDLIDYNAQYNPSMVVSYPVEVSYLSSSEVFSVWQNSIQEFMRRQYMFVDAVELRNSLENLRSETPHTPIYVWYDNMTDSDVVVQGENTPFAMVTSPYGRFIYARRDSMNDSGSPLVSVTSYTTARAYNDSFQSIRELTGSDDFKMNTFVNDVPIEMRWTGDIQNVSIISGKAIVIRWVYLKHDVPYVEYYVTTYLTPYGVLMEKELFFKQNVTAKVSVVQYISVQENSPKTLTDSDTRIETDRNDIARFFSNNTETTPLYFGFNDTLIFVAKDGYTLGVTVTSGRPNVIRAIDKSGASPYETLRFNYITHNYYADDNLHLSYALTPATDIIDAQNLARFVVEIAKNADSPQDDQLFSVFITPLLVIFLVVLTGAFLLKLRRFSSKEKKARCINL